MYVFAIETMPIKINIILFVFINKKYAERKKRARTQSAFDDGFVLADAIAIVHIAERVYFLPLFCRRTF